MKSMTFRDVWDRTLEQLKEMVSKNALEMWILPLEPVAYENDAMILICPSVFQRDIVMSRYKDIIVAAMTETVGFEMNIDVLTPEERKRAAPTAHVPEPENKIEESLEKLTSSLAHPEFSFDNFIVGDSNRHAQAACMAVAKNPSGAYNPLFIHGPTGLGKTHLLHAIHNEVLKDNPHKKCLYVRSEDFINELVESMKQHTMTEFKNKYRTLDLFMVDGLRCNWRTGLRSLRYLPQNWPLADWQWFDLAMTALQIAWILFLMIWLGKCLLPHIPPLDRKKRDLLAAGWLLFVLLHTPWLWMAVRIDLLRILLICLTDWLRFALLSVLIACQTTDRRSI